MNSSVVLTGDLIGSTKASLEAVDQAMAALAGAADESSLWVGADTRFTRFRGDGWQIHLANPKLVLRATLLLLARLRNKGGGLETRLSIAEGQVDRLGTQNLADASGEAFFRSGRNLDNAHAVFNYFVYASPNPDYPLKAAVMEMANWQARRWTPEQAEAVALAIKLPRPTDEAMATTLGISRQALQSRLKGSGLMATSSALFAFEVGSSRPEQSDA